MPGPREFHGSGLPVPKMTRLHFGFPDLRSEHLGERDEVAVTSSDEVLALADRDAGLPAARPPVEAWLTGPRLHDGGRDCKGRHVVSARGACCGVQREDVALRS